MPTQTAVFDLYYLLVELIFGSVIWAWLGMSLIFLVLGFFFKISPKSLLFFLVMFTFALMVPINGIFGMLVFSAALLYFSWEAIYKPIREAG